MRVCAHCGKSNEAQYKFCLGCGSDLPEETVGLPSAAPTAAPTAVTSCFSCNAAVPEGYRFCPNCGADQQRSAPTTGGQLVLIRPDGTDGGTHPLMVGENAIGRAAGLLFEADGYLSPHHAELELGAAGLIVRDANSRNGVFVKVQHEEEIFDGDVFRIGQELLRFDVIPAPQLLEDGTEILGSPNPGYWGRLAIIIGADQEGSAFPLNADSIQLGRERGDILFPEDGYVSGSHAKVSLRDGSAWLEDLGSSNGTFLQIRGELQVAAGSFLLMGQQLFRVEY